MDFIEHTLNWCKGEIFEGKLSLLFGIVILLVSLSYWKFGSTDAARAMFVPMLVVALLTMTIGGYLMHTNSKRILEYKEAYAHNEMEFIRAEKDRTEAFISWYPKTQYIFFGIMITGMLCLILSHRPIIRAVGIALMLAALYTFVLDHFSEERASTYHSHIVENLPS